MLHIPVATVIITFGSRLLSLSPHERLILAPVAIIVLAFASVVSLRTFETPLRRYLTEMLTIAAPSGPNRLPRFRGRRALMTVVERIAG